MDGWTDGITVASTALAMRALWRAVKRFFLLAASNSADVIFLDV